MSIPLNLNEKLASNVFRVNAKQPHITLKPNLDDAAQSAIVNTLIAACPAGLYRLQNDRLICRFEGCLECGTCRVLSSGKVVKSCKYPDGGVGVEYRQG
jgi:ferredoxin like protein